LSRLGKDSTFVFMGDNRQNDRTKGDAAYVQFMNRFAVPRYIDAGFVGHVVLGADDTRRHPFLKLIVENGDERPLEQFETHYSGANVAVLDANKKNGTHQKNANNNPATHAQHRNPS